MEDSDLLLPRLVILGQLHSSAPLRIFVRAIMVLVGHCPVDHKLLVLGLLVGLEGEDAVGTVLASWHAVPHALA